MHLPVRQDGCGDQQRQSGESEQQRPRSLAGDIGARFCWTCVASEAPASSHIVHALSLTGITLTLRWLSTDDAGLGDAGVLERDRIRPSWERGLR